MTYRRLLAKDRLDAGSGSLVGIDLITVEAP